VSLPAAAFACQKRDPPQAVQHEQGSGQLLAAVDCCFMCQDGSMFKARLPYAPYFYIGVRPGSEADVDGLLRRRFEGSIRDIQIVEREDLDLARPPSRPGFYAAAAGAAACAAAMGRVKRRGAAAPLLSCSPCPPRRPPFQRERRRTICRG
jgi:hypothetical protein